VQEVGRISGKGYRRRQQARRDAASATYGFGNSLAKAGAKYGQIPQHNINSGARAMI